VNTKKVATLVEWCIRDHKNTSAVYRLDPPLEHGDLVFVSASHFLGGTVMALDAIMGNGPRRSRETMVFPIVNGKPDYSGDGLCMVPHETDHAKALKKLGYKILEERCLS